MWGASQNEHELQIVEETINLLQKGFTVYLEYEIFLEEGTQKRVVPDIYAKKGKREIVIEVGTLCERGWIEGRLNFLKKLLPKATIIHVTQWKNWINQCEWQELWWNYYMRRHSCVEFPVV